MAQGSPEKVTSGHCSVQQAVRRVLIPLRCAKTPSARGTGVVIKPKLVLHWDYFPCQVLASPWPS